MRRLTHSYRRSLSEANNRSVATIHDGSRYRPSNLLLPPEAELETKQRDLRRAHQTIARLIILHRDSSIELATLKVEHERLRWTLSDACRRESERETARMGYACGDHTKGTAPGLPCDVGK